MEYNHTHIDISLTSYMAKIVAHRLSSEPFDAAILAVEKIVVAIRVGVKLLRVEIVVEMVWTITVQR